MYHDNAVLITVAYMYSKGEANIMTSWLYPIQC